MAIPKRFITAVLIVLLSMAISVSCDRKKPAQTVAATKPPEAVMTWTPVLGGSAKLNYQMVVKNPPLFTAVETEEILLNWRYEPEKPKQVQEFFGNIDNGSYFVQVEGLRGGEPCFMWFDIPVKYSVFGVYSPSPNCSFTLTIQGSPQPNTAERGQNCGPEMEGQLQQYPAEVLYIPPPDTKITIPGSQSISIPINEWATLDLFLTEIIVPEATGCQW